MKSFSKFAVVIALSSFALIQGCTTHLSSGQQDELAVYEQKNLLVKEKSPVLAGVLGILPMAGYLYTGHYVLSVTTLPLYPFLGPLWMPFDVAGSAENRNYYATKREAERSKARDLLVIDQKLEDKTLTYEQHIREQRVIESKYAAY